MANDKKAKEMNLVVGTKIKIGKKYSKHIRGHLKPGDIITLVEGYFEHDNGLYTETQTAPAIWCGANKEYDSIYHLFGNDLEDFMDCKIITDAH